MKHQRNVDGLRQNAQKKRQESFEKVDQGIQALLKASRPINFNTVEEVSGVSKAWLYKEPDVKARIEQLRAQSNKRQAAQPKHRLSDGSKDALIATLKTRIKKLEQRNQELSQQNEVFGGQVLRVRELEQQVKRLRAENAALHQQLEEFAQEQGTTTGSSVLTFSVVETELEKLGVQLNTTIQRLLAEAPQQMITTALESLKEASLEKRVANPSGFFYRAVTDAWQPNEMREEKEKAELFNEWWDLAHARGLVVAATEIEGVQHILTPDQQWIPFAEIVQKLPLEALQQREDI